LVVQVSVVANDSAGRPLTYRWQATDGSIENVNVATTTWTLPDGPGLHFAYVLVSNGVGGYTEQRVVVNTDTFGTPLQVPTPVAFSPPTAPGPNENPTVSVRGFLKGGSVNEALGIGAAFSTPFPTNVPDVSIFADDLGVLYPPVGTVNSNVRGEFIIPNVTPTTLDDNGFLLFCGSAAPFIDCGKQGPQINGSSLGFFTQYSGFSFNILDNAGASEIVGNFVLQDASPCGIVDEFFGVEVVPTVILLDGSGKVLAGPDRADPWGDYNLPNVTGAASVSIQCESSPPILVPVSSGAVQGSSVNMGTTTLTGSNAPALTSMTVEMDGTPLKSPAQFQFLPSPTGVPSDIVPLGDAFLAEKGLDSRVGACQYYKAVGAVQSCDSAGNFSGAITFEDWKSQVKIDYYAPTGTTVYTATYVNKEDLNVTRNHHSVSYSTNVTQNPPFSYIGTYVTNHLGPSLNPPQSEIDTVVQNAVSGLNEIASVAMDYSSAPGVNDNSPFVRFLIFGPNGQLLPSINLDQRREKFVPGACIVCHGGNRYVGKFPEDGSGLANVGAHFLPYDPYNFEFSDQPSLTQATQEPAIYHLNQNISNTAGAGTGGLTPATAALIVNWYGGGQVVNPNYVDPSWIAALAGNVYQQVYARSCRTCHIALERYNFENFGTFAQAPPIVDPINCGGGFDHNRSFKMPNSLITFNRFWSSYGSTSEPDQVSMFHALFKCTNNPSANSASTKVFPARGKAAHK
jgi:mono/diheme cytochrome c family protein